MIFYSDSIYDRFGKAYPRDSVKFPESEIEARQGGGGHNCIAGIFIPTFVDQITNTNKGFDDTTIYSGSVTLGEIRRTVLCQVLRDVSSMLVPTLHPCTGDTTFVELEIKESMNANNGILGKATANYDIPASAGITTGYVFQVINSGTSTIGPFEYHGWMKFNFHNSLKLFYELDSASIPGNYYDFYSIVLHEVFHTLGFASLINSNGTSLLSITNPGLYLPYDEHLEYNGTPFIQTDCHVAYFNDTTFDPPAFYINGTCNNVKFNGVNAGLQPVYAPTSYTAGHNLSHFHTDCSGVGTTPGYLMYAFADTGTLQHRNPTAGEVGVLCDIGYETTGNFGDSTYWFHNDTFPECGGKVVGVPDGLDDGCGSTYVVSQCDSIVIADFLDNDTDIDSFNCLEVLFGGGSIVMQSDTSFVYYPGNLGRNVVGYMPVGANGQQGYTTPIFITVVCCGNDTTCPNLSACNQLCNPGFTNVDTTGFMNCSNLSSPCYNPYDSSRVPGWGFSHGSPQWGATNAQPPDGYGYARLWTRYYSRVHKGEGIFTCVDIQKDSSYIFSFYRAGFKKKTDTLYVKLAKSTVSNFPVCSGSSCEVPNINNTFLVYRELDLVANQTWEQVVTCFTADDDYDQLWIYGNNDRASASSTLSWTWVDLVEINQDIFTAGPDRGIFCGSQTILGDDLCSFTNMVYEWRTVGDSTVIDTGSKLTVSPNRTTSYVLTRTFNPLNGYGFAYLDSNCIISDTVTVIVIDEADATYSFSQIDSGCAWAQYEFTSSDSSYEHYWDFGDGGTDTLPNPVYTFNSTGTFQVMHVHFNDCNSDTVYNTIVVSNTCCVVGDSTFNNITASQLIRDHNGGSNIITTNLIWVFNDTLLIDTNLIFRNSPNIRMGPFASIVIQSGATLTLDTSRISAACDTFWKGISITGSGLAMLYMYESIIEDADTAIRSMDCGKFFIFKGSKLRNNYCHIDIRNCSAANPALIKGAELKTTKYFDYYPHEPDSLPYNAIQIDNCIQVKIGTSGSQSSETLIEYFTYSGIDAKNIAELIVANLRITNAQLLKPKLADNAYGIRAKSITNNLVIGEGPGFTGGSARGSKFISLRKGGISIDNCKNTSISWNSFYNMGTRSINIYKNSDYVNIYNNNIDESAHGIYLDGNVNAKPVTVTNNTIISSPSATGIRFSLPAKVDNNLLIDSNDITGARFGIHVINTYNAEITNNTVRFVTGQQTTNRNYGIGCDNCDSVIVKNNTVLNTDITKSLKSGITLAFGDAATVCSNTVENMERGLEFYKELLGSVVQLNVMDSCERGLVLRQNGIIGQQGDMLAPSDNQWFNSDLSDTYCMDRSFGNLSDFWIRDSMSFAPSLDKDPGSVLIDTFHTSGNAATCDLPGSNKMASNIAAPDLYKRLQLLSQALRDSTLSDNRKWLRKYAVYKHIYSRNFALQDFPFLLRVYNHIKQTDVAATIRVEEKIKAAFEDSIINWNLLRNAYQINMAIQPTAEAGLYQKQANAIYLDYLFNPGAYSPTELATLKSIAALCPYEYGPGVFQARVMLAEIDTTDYSASEDCRTNTSFKVPREAVLDNKNEDSYRFEIYPNPASESVIVNYQITTEKPTLLEFIDVYGRIVKKVELPAEVNSITISVADLSSGIYYYRHLVDKKKRTTGKLIINR